MCVSTHSSFKDAVVDVVGAALRAGEGEPLTVFVALLVGQLDRSAQHAVSLFLPLVLLLSPELTRVQTWHGQKIITPQIVLSCRIYVFFCSNKIIRKKSLHTDGAEQNAFHPNHLILRLLDNNETSILHFYETVVISGMTAFLCLAASAVNSL